MRETGFEDDTCFVGKLGLKQLFLASNSRGGSQQIKLPLVYGLNVSIIMHIFSKGKAGYVTFDP